MPATKPTNVPRWTDVTTANRVEPVSIKKDSGFATGEKPPAQNLNWLFWMIYQWILWLQDLQAEALTWTALNIFQAGIQVTQSSSNTSATVTTGNGTGHGCLGTGGTSSGDGGHFQGGAGAGSGVDGTGGASGGVGGKFHGGTGAGTGCQGFGGTGGGAAGGQFTGGSGGDGCQGQGGSGAGAGGNFTGGAGGIGCVSQGGSGAAGAQASGGTNASGVVALGNGTGAALVASAGSNGHGAVCTASGNKDGCQGLGSGTGRGLFGQGGTSAGNIGCQGIGGGTNGNGGQFIGVGTGWGCTCVGGNNDGTGLIASGAVGHNGIAVDATGTGTAPAVWAKNFDNGNAFVASRGVSPANFGSPTCFIEGVAQNATDPNGAAIWATQLQGPLPACIVMNQGPLEYRGTSPGKQTDPGFDNVLHGYTIPKAWTKINTTPSGTTHKDGANCTVGVAGAGGSKHLVITFARNMLNADYAIALAYAINNGGANGICDQSALQVRNQTASGFEIWTSKSQTPAYSTAGAGQPLLSTTASGTQGDPFGIQGDLSAGADVDIFFIVMGRQHN